MHRLFEKNSPIIYVLCLLLTILFGIKLFNRCPFLSSDQSIFIIRSFTSEDSSKILLSKVISFCIWIYMLFGVFGLYSQKDINIRNASLPIYTILIFGISALSFEISLSDFIFVGYVFILILQLYKIRKESKTTNNFHGMGLALGISCLISIHMIVIIPIMFFVWGNFGKSGIKDLLALIIGILIPIYTLAAYSYLADEPQIWSHYFTAISLFEYSLPKKYEYLALVICFIGTIKSLPYTQNFNINTRKIYTILTVVFFLYFGLSLCLRVEGSSLIFCVMFISSLFLHIYISQTRNKKLQNILLAIGLIWSFLSTFWL